MKILFYNLWQPCDVGQQPWLSTHRHVLPSHLFRHPPDTREHIPLAAQILHTQPSPTWQVRPLHQFGSWVIKVEVRSWNWASKNSRQEKEVTSRNPWGIMVKMAHSQVHICLPVAMNIHSWKCCYKCRYAKVPHHHWIPKVGWEARISLPSPASLLYKLGYVYIVNSTLLDMVPLCCAQPEHQY